MGLRQHRHAVPGLSPGGCSAGRLREDRRCCHRAPIHRDRGLGRTPYPVGCGGRLRGAYRLRWRARPAHRGHQLQHVPGRGLSSLDRSCHPSAEVRAKAVKAIVECCDIASRTGSKAVKVWLGDGTNYPGQDDLRGRRHRLVDGPSRRSISTCPRTSACSWSTSCTNRRCTRPMCRIGARHCGLSPRR